MGRASRRIPLRWPLGLSAAAALFAGIGWWLDARRFEAEVGAARALFASGRPADALPGLRAISSRWPGRGGGEADYLLAVAMRAAGAGGEVLEALGRVPNGSPFAPRAAVVEAEVLLERGAFRPAEEVLSAALKDPGDAGPALRSALLQMLRAELRREEVAALLREGIEDDPDPTRRLYDLFVLDRGTPPLPAIRAALDAAHARSPDDDRVWLGLARLAIVEGRAEEAGRWLDRCASRGRDPAVLRARLDWARLAGRPGPALAALRALGPAAFDAAGRRGWAAWLARSMGDAGRERAELDAWLELEPNRPEAIDRRAELAFQSGRVDEGRTLRARKAAVDRALDEYRRRIASGSKPTAPAEHLALADLAEAAGRPLDARTWTALAVRSDPASVEAASALRRRDELLARRTAPSEPADPWAAFESLAADSDGSRPEERSRAAFEDVAESSRLSFVFRNGESTIRQLPETMAGGVGLLDVDGDGRLDVYLTQGGRFPEGPGVDEPGDRLFRNQGGWRFEDATESTGLSGFARGYGHGVAVGDVDNDGRPDLFVTRWDGYALYRNRGGRFEDVTVAAGLSGRRGWPTSAAFADLDGDGDLDLYVCHYLRWDPKDPRLCTDARTRRYVSCDPKQFEAEPDRLFRNDGGRFVDVTEASGILGADVDGRGLGVVAADLDDDGLIDLFVANDKTANFLFRNLGGLRFEEVGVVAGVAANAEGGFRAGMGVACGDVDADGRSDLAVTNFYGEATTLYRNLGRGAFADSTAAAGLAGATRDRLGFGVAFLDADLDGSLDLLTANGHLDDLGDQPYRMAMQLLRGRGDGTLEDGTARAGEPFRVPRLARALAVGDLDDDGRPDAVAVDLNAPAAVLRNASPGPGRFIGFRLEGVRSNRDGVGARVEVRWPGGRRVGWRIGGGSYQSAGDPRVHFGLGPEPEAVEVEVRWPSGQVDRHGALTTGRYHHLREGGPAASPSR